MIQSYIAIEDIIDYGYQVDETDEKVLKKIAPRAARIFDLFADAAPGHFGKFEAAAGAPDGGAVEQVFYGDGSAILRLPPYVGPLAAGAVTLPPGYSAPEFSERTDRYGNQYLQRAATAQAVSLMDEAAWFRGTLQQTGWPAGVPVKVKAKWGFAATPDDVKEAVLELTIAIWRSKDPAFAKVIRLDDKEIISQALPDRTKQIAALYAKRGAGEVAI